MTTCDEDDLQAFVDGEPLPPERRRTVMAYLALHAVEAARVDDYRRLSEQLRLLYDKVMAEPLPSRLQLRRRRGWRARLVPLAAGVALLLTGGGGWMLGFHSVEPEVKIQWGYDEPESLLHRLSKLDHAVYVPNLEEAGFALRGGHVVPAAAPTSLQGAGAGRPTALLMYENPTHHPDGTLADKPPQRIALYIDLGAAADDETIRLGTQGGLCTVRWMAGSLAYRLQGALNAEQVFAIAKIVLQRQAVELPPPEPKQDAA